jgi:DNA-binding NtrC family response regulator
VLVLAQHFAGRLSRRYGRHITLSRPALELFLTHPFPGNVRELENILEGLAALSHDDPQVISDKDLEPLLRDRTPAASGGLADQPLSMERLEQFAIQQALRLCQGNRTKAASLLGISRDTLYRKLRQFPSEA